MTGAVETATSSAVAGDGSRPLADPVERFANEDLYRRGFAVAGRLLSDTPLEIP